MLDEEFAKLPKNAWKPFGSGVRSCIGFGFAWQEALAVVALLLQIFDLTLDDPSYEAKIKQTLTIKPSDYFCMRASLREGIDATTLQTFLSRGIGGQAIAKEVAKEDNAAAGHDIKPMTILYGSNSGTCLSLAQKLNVQARSFGYQAIVKEMNAAVGRLSTEQPTIIITASYEGQPPDNAGQCVAWLETQVDDKCLSQIQYAVFGCGHSDWRNTYQRIPTLCDDLLAKHGANRIAQRGDSDAAKGDISSTFDCWTESLWNALVPVQQSPIPQVTGLEINIESHDRSLYLRQDVQMGQVLKESRLTANDEPEKRHLEVRLPKNMTYEAGDYLSVLPFRPEVSVRRVMAHFKLAHDSMVTIKAGSATFLPTDVSIAVHDLLRGFVELGQPVTRNELKACADACQSSVERVALAAFTDEDGFAEITKQRSSLLDLLEKFRSIDMSFGTFFSMMPPLRPRLYSISSSPLMDSNVCTITYGVINEEARSGSGRFIGVTGAYLASLKAGDDVAVSVRSVNKFFHLPANTEGLPVMMFCGGTGIAPFRGFVQERAVQIAAGRKVAPALLFIGCRSSIKDRLYADEMDQWAASGAVDIRYAFSKEPEKSEGCKYVQDRILKDRVDVLRLWREGAKVFTCGSPEFSEGIGKAAGLILREALQERGQEPSDQEVRDWFAERRNERFVVDVFA